MGSSWPQVRSEFHAVGSSSPRGMRSTTLMRFTRVLRSLQAVQARPPPVQSAYARSKDVFTLAWHSRARFAKAPSGQVAPLDACSTSLAGTQPSANSPVRQYIPTDAPPPPAALGGEQTAVLVGATNNGKYQ